MTNADASYWNYGYDTLGQVTNGWRFWPGDSNVLGQSFNYTFDDVGNRQSTATGGDDTGANLRSASYAVNLLNQYTNRTVPGYLEVNGTATNTATVRVNGTATERQGDYFRREVSVDNSSAALVQWLNTVATNASGTTIMARLSYVPQTPEAFSHDADGNLTQDGLWDYTWDAENRLTGIQTRTNAITDTAYWQRIECDYDHLSRRLRKRVFGWDTAGGAWHLTSSTRFFYDGWNLVGQVDEVTGERMSFLWGTDLSGTFQGAGGVGGLTAVVVHNGPEAGTYFCGYDGNGNVAVLVDGADGSEAARYEYGPFGELIRSTGDLARVNPFRFSTKYQDEETDLLYYGYRYYTAGTGRWLSRDPIEEEGGINTYLSLLNNPLIWFDPNGLDSYAINPMAPTTVNNSVGVVSIPLSSISSHSNPSTGDNNSAFALGWGWLTGNSTSTRTFSGNDQIAREMRSSPEAKKVRNELKAGLKDGCEVGKSVFFERTLASGYWGNVAYPMGFALDISPIDLGGHTPSRAFMGSFDGTATIVDCYGCCAVVKFRLWNDAGWSSATRLPAFGYRRTLSDGGPRPAFTEAPGHFISGWIRYPLGRMGLVDQVDGSDYIPISILHNDMFGRFGRTIRVNVSWEESICPE